MPNSPCKLQKHSNNMELESIFNGNVEFLHLNTRVLALSQEMEGEGLLGHRVVEGKFEFAFLLSVEEREARVLDVVDVPLPHF